MQERRISERRKKERRTDIRAARNHAGMQRRVDERRRRERRQVRATRKPVTRERASKN